MQTRATPFFFKQSLSLWLVLGIAVTCWLSAWPAVAGDEIGCTIRGVVTSADGRPLAGASVRVTTASDAATTRSASNGEFYLLVGPGKGRIRAELPGHGTVEKVIAPTDGQTLRIHLIMKPLSR